jgi:O-antigen/teichoic acid export membrane protein
VPAAADIPPSVAGRIRAHVREPLFRGAYSLMAGTAVTALLGIAFWAIAARSAPAAEVGRDAALISSLITLSAICQLNLVDAIVRFLPGVRRATQGRAIVAAYAATAVAGLLGGLAFVLVAPAVSSQLRFLADDRWLAAAFVGSMALWGVFVLQDSALTAMRRATWVPIENGAFSLAKIALLPVLVSVGSTHAVFLAWMLPTLVVVPIVNALLFGRVLRRAWRAAPDEVAERSIGGRELVRFLAQDYAGFVLGQAAVTLVPLIVVAQLGNAASAHFYMPFMLVVAFDLLFYNVTTSMTVEGAHDERRTAHLATTVVRRFLVVLAPAALVVSAAAPIVLIPFGQEYVDQGSGVLRLLALASIPRAIVCLYVAIARLQGRGRAILATQASVFAGVVVLALALAGPLGLPGIGLAWLAGNALVAVVVAPRLVALLRSGAAPAPAPTISPELP